VHTTARISEPRHAITPVTVGETALFVGGWTDGDVLPTVDLFDAKTASWSTAALSEPRVGPVTAIIGDLLIIAGGRPRNGGSSRAVDIYDSRSGTWAAATLSRPFYGGLTYDGSEYNGQPPIVVAGRFAVFISTEAVDVFNTATGAWATHVLAEPRYWPAVAVVGETVVIAGGNLQGKASAAVDLFDGATETWSQATLSVARTHAAPAVAGSMAIIAGGYRPTETSDPPPIPVADLYDAATGTWTTSPLTWDAKANQFSSFGQFGAVSIGDVAVIFGGLGGLDIYDAVDRSWRSVLTSRNFHLLTVTRTPEQMIVLLGMERPEVMMRVDAATREVLVRAHPGRSGTYQAPEAFVWPSYYSDGGLNYSGSRAIVGGALVEAGGSQTGSRGVHSPLAGVAITDLDTGDSRPGLSLGAPTYGGPRGVIGSRMILVTDTTLEEIDVATSTITSRPRSRPTWVSPSVAVAGQYVLAAGGDLPESKVEGRDLPPPLPGVVDTVEIFDAATGTWSEAKLSRPRRFAVATTIGSTALFIGGYDRPEASSSDAVDLYDAASGTWWAERLPDPMAPGEVQQAPVGQTGVALLRDSERADLANEGRLVTQMVVFDAATRRWETVPLSPTRQSATLGVVGTKALAVGGYDLVANAPLDVVDLYDLATGGSWTARLSVPRRAPVVASVGSRLVVAGGADDLTADIYDADAGTWTTATIPAPFLDRRYVGASYAARPAVVVGARILFDDAWLGTDPARDRRAAVIAYDADTDRWSVVGFGSQDSRRSVALGSTVLYLVSSTERPSADMDVYDDRTRQWSTTTAPLPLWPDLLVAVIAGRWALFSGNSSKYGIAAVYDAEDGSWSSGHLPDVLLAAYPAAAESYGQPRPLGSDRSSNVVVDAATAARYLLDVSPRRSVTTVAQVGRQVVVAGGVVAEVASGDGLGGLDVFTLPPA
jgi:hypothetical protein